MFLKEVFEGKEKGAWLGLPGDFKRRSDGLKCWLAVGDDGAYYMNWMMDHWLGPFSMMEVWEQFYPFVREPVVAPDPNGSVRCSEEATKCEVAS